MEFVKHNQLLKIRVAYDQTSGCNAFDEFIDDNDLESISGYGYNYAYFPDSPRWTKTEINGMTEEEVIDWKERFDWDWDRYTLADVSWKDWYEVAEEEELLPYRHTATGYSQGDWSHLYLLGMDEEEAESLTAEFESYAYETPYYYTIDLVDCETGETIDEAGLGGIYDSTSGLKDLKGYIAESLRSMDGLHPELMTSALEAVNELEYSDIES